MSLFDSASLVVTPNGVKEGKLYSIKPSDGSGDLSVTRATTATRVNSAGLVEVVPYNLLQRSEQFDNVYWTKATATISANATTAPNGTTTADKLIGNNLSTASNVNVAIVVSQGVNYNFSVYAKAAGANWIQLIATGTTIASPARLWVNLSTGTLGTNNGGFLNATIENAGNGWYRISGYFTTTSTTTTLYYAPATNDNINGYNGNGTDGLFLWGAQLVSGTSAKDYFPTTDRLNIPRLDYTNSSCPSILVEPQRTNIFAKSQTTSTWSFTNISRTANNGISPDGTQNADLLFPTTSGAVSFNSDNTASSLVVGQPFICSFFIKLNTSFTSNVGANIIDLRLSGAAVWTRPTIRVNFETGEVTNVTNASYISSTNYGNGWYRITFGAIPTGTGAAVGLQTPTGVTLNGGSFYIWGLQGESNSTYATSYIPTTSASVTRNADQIFKTGISSLIGQTEGTVFLDWKQNGFSNSQGIFANNFNLTGSISIQVGADGMLYGYVCYNNTFFLISAPAGTIQIGQRYKIGFAYKSGNSALYLNGNLIGTNNGSFAFTTTLSEIDLSNRNVYFAQTCETSVKTTAIWKERLTNDQLAQLTTI
jgi:hypothetical protein